MPKRIKTVSTFSAPIRGSMGGKTDLNSLANLVAKHGVRGFSALTMTDRLGHALQRQ
jgi:hypothetical protein